MRQKLISFSITYRKYVLSGVKTRKCDMKYYSQYRIKHHTFKVLNQL